MSASEEADSGAPPRSEAAIRSSDAGRMPGSWASHGSSPRSPRTADESARSCRDGPARTEGGIVCSGSALRAGGSTCACRSGRDGSATDWSSREVRRATAVAGRIPPVGALVHLPRSGLLALRLAERARRFWAGCPLAELDPLGDDLGDQFFGLPAGRAIADRNHPDLVLAHQVLESELGLGSAILGRMGIDDGLIEQVTRGSRTATLQPDRSPGSMARTTCLGIGGCSSRLRRFRAKTSTACRSAASVRSRRTSRSMLGRMSRSSASIAAARKTSA